MVVIMKHINKIIRSQITPLKLSFTIALIIHIFLLNFIGDLIKIDVMNEPEINTKITFKMVPPPSVLAMANDKELKRKDLPEIREESKEEVKKDNEKKILKKPFKKTEVTSNSDEKEPSIKIKNELVDKQKSLNNKNPDIEKEEEKIDQNKLSQDHNIKNEKNLDAKENRSYSNGFLDNKKEEVLKRVVLNEQIAEEFNKEKEETIDEVKIEKKEIEINKTEQKKILKKEKEQFNEKKQSNETMKLNDKKDENFNIDIEKDKDKNKAKESYQEKRNKEITTQNHEPEVKEENKKREALFKHQLKKEIMVTKGEKIVQNINQINTKEKEVINKSEITSNLEGNKVAENNKDNTLKNIEKLSKLINQQMSETVDKRNEPINETIDKKVVNKLGEKKIEKDIIAEKNKEKERENQSQSLQTSNNDRQKQNDGKVEKLSDSNKEPNENSKQTEVERVDLTQGVPDVGIVPPGIIEYKQPVYPEEMRKRGIEGRVILKILIDTVGKVIKIRIEESSGYKQFDKVAKETVLGWQFKPTRKDGKKVESWILVPIRFKLN